MIGVNSTAENVTSSVRERGACQLPTLAEVTVTGSVNTTKVDDKHIADATLMVVDEQGNPVPDIELTGVFTGDLSAPATLTTGPDGLAHATTAGGGQHLVVGFTVNSAVRVAADGSRSPVTSTTEIIYPSPCCSGRTQPSQ